MFLSYSITPPLSFTRYPTSYTDSLHICAKMESESTPLTFESQLNQICTTVTAQHNAYTPPFNNTSFANSYPQWVPTEISTTYDGVLPLNKPQPYICTSQFISPLNRPNVSSISEYTYSGYKTIDTKDQIQREYDNLKQLYEKESKAREQQDKDLQELEEENSSLRQKCFQLRQRLLHSRKLFRGTTNKIMDALDAFPSWYWLPQEAGEPEAGPVRDASNDPQHGN